MLETDRLGWEAWVAAKWLLPSPVYEFPPSERVLSPRRGDWLASLLRRGLRGRESWWLERPIASVKPALIHAHFGWTALDAVSAARRHRLPLVAGFHGYDATVFPHHGFGADDEPAGAGVSGPSLYDELFREADCILATSRFIASRLHGLGCEREVEVVPSGIRLECFPFRGPRPGAPTEYRLLFIGRIVPYKGLDVALRALAALGRDDGGSTTLTVVGDGPARPACEALAESLGVADLVDFRGRQPRSGVLEALEESDLLIVPSRTTAAGQAEGLGNVVKEAIAVGLEVAVADNGGLPEVVPPDRRSEMFAEGDPRALAERLEAARKLRGAWGERAERGRRWVEEEFDWRRLAPLIADVYARVVSGASRGGR